MSVHRDGRRCDAIADDPAGYDDANYQWVVDRTGRATARRGCGQTFAMKRPPKGLAFHISNRIREAGNKAIDPTVFISKQFDQQRHLFLIVQRHEGWRNLF